MKILVGQVAQAARRFAAGWTARIGYQVVEGVEISFHSFVSIVNYDT